MAENWTYDPELGFVDLSSGEVVPDAGESGAVGGPEQVGGGQDRERTPAQPSTLGNHPADAPRTPPPLPEPVAKFMAAERSAVIAPRTPPAGGGISTWDPYKTPLFFRRMFWALLDKAYAQRQWLEKEWQTRFDAAVHDLRRDHSQCEAELAAFEAYIGVVIWETNMAVTNADDRGWQFRVYTYQWPGKNGTTGLQNKPVECPGTWEPPPKPEIKQNETRPPRVVHPAERFAARVAALPEGRTPPPPPKSAEPTLFGPGASASPRRHRY